MNPRTARLAHLTLVSVAYVGAGLLGLKFASFQGAVTLIWPPTGIALAALTLRGLALWPAVLVGAFVVAYSVGLPPGVCAGLAVGNTLEAWLGARALQRLGLSAAFDRTRDALALAGVAASCSLVSALVGVTALYLGNLGQSPASYPAVVVEWWLGDATGALCVAPALISGLGRSTLRISPHERTHWTFTFAGFALGLFVFATPAHAPNAMIALLLLMFVALMLAGFAGDARHTTTLSLLLCLTATLGTAAGRGPLVTANVHETALTLWSFITVVACTALLVTALVGERRAMQERLLETQRMDSVALLAGGVAHDFNNMLHAVRGYLELTRAELDGCAEERVFGLLDRADKAAERAASLTQQLLYFGRRAPSERRQVEVGKLIRGTAELLEPSLGARIVLKLEAPERGLTVLADERQLEQVLVNLCLNARDAMADGGSLSVRAESHDVGAQRRVRIAVCDTGHGIPPHIMARIYEPFFTTKPVGRGTGLGLSVVHGIVKQHGGSVTVSSEAGLGTTFTIDLPHA